MNRCGTHLGYRDHQNRHEPTCRPCRDAQAAWQRDYEIRRYVARGGMLVDATGTRRRLQALAVMGWRTSDLAERLGSQRTYVSDQMCRQRPFVRRSTAEKVAALYDELSMVHGPSRQVARVSRGKGWVGPLAWDDDGGPGGIDDPAARPMHNLRGDTGGRPRDPDLAEQVMHLTRAGLSAAEIALRLRVSNRLVQRVRSRHRQDGQVA